MSSCSRLYGLRKSKANVEIQIGRVAQVTLGLVFILMVAKIKSVSEPSLDQIVVGLRVQVMA